MNSTRVERPPVVQEQSAENPLSALAELAREFGSERVYEEATGLSQRTAEGRFFVACVGQFKRGKSTLLNALLGDRILPTGVLPLTTVPTVVRFGGSRRARVRFKEGMWTDIRPEDLSQYVSEDLNPENKKGVVGVEVFCPSPLLAEGMCLVDTPGLGSVFAGNTAATQAFIPHVDAAIVVVGADPPIAGEELVLVGEIGKQVANLVVVLNKADRTSEEERRIAKSFTARMLERHLRLPIGHIYEVSAEEKLRNEGPIRDWKELVAALQKLVSESGRDLVRAAGQRGFKRLSEDLSTILSEEREALVRPLEQSELRIRNLRQTISEAERSLRDMNYLFTAEEHHLSDKFLDQRKEFLSATVPTINAEFQEELAALPRHFGPRFRRDALRAAQVVSEAHIRPWLETEQAAAEREYRKVASRFVNIGNDFLKKLAESGVPEFVRMPNALDSDRGFRVPSHFTFEQLLHVALPASPLRYLSDVFLGMVRAYGVIERKAWAFLGHLVETNSTRVQSDVVNRVQESRGQLEVEIRKLLHEVTRIAEHALDRARAAKAEGTPAVEAALARLERAERSLLNLDEFGERNLIVESSGQRKPEGRND
ncbi:MAG TPA: dynamin family protein [Candidatus Acidoferrum sp.]|nr:dynamin family protein [Candidatus Acidoferrum sp.]